MDNPNRPKLGLALSGAAARSVFYIGFLEVLQENNVQIDYISSNSGACVVAAAFACGTLPELKALALSLDREFLFSVIQRSKGKGGIYSMDKVEEALRQFTKNLRFEDVRPLMGFTCTNINSGEEIVLGMGDIAKAICASCALPGIFKPVRWGAWDLVDGGLVSIVPGRAAREAGCDVVVGIYVSPKERVFNNFEIGLKKIVDFFYKGLGIQRLKLILESSANSISESKYFNSFNSFNSNDDRNNYGMFTVLGRAMDIAIKAEGESDKGPANYGCDFIVKPPLPNESAFKRLSYLYLADLTSTKYMYEYGRQTALETLPKLKTLLEEKTR